MPNDIPRSTDPNPAFPSNSDTSKLTDSSVGSRRPTRVTKGVVKVRKKTPGKTFAESFIAEDAKNVGNYILYDVLIPALKTTVNDIVSMGIERLLYGGDRPNASPHANRNRSIVSYGGYYNKPAVRSSAPPIHTVQTRRVRQSFEDIVLETRGEAEDVVASLILLMEQYGTASLSDLYDLVGIDSTHVDFNYGWDEGSIPRITVTRTRDGYAINLPRPVALK